MSQEERYDTRDGAYSAWHRRESTRRFVGIERAQTLSMIDLDAPLYVEYDDKTKHPIALIETAIDVGQETKPATVTKNLARGRNPELRAYVVLYKLSKQQKNPANPRWQDIEQFRVRRIWPEPETPARGWKVLTPGEWANWLVEIRKMASSPLDDLPT